MTKLGYADPENFEIFAFDNLADTDWGKPMVEYLENLTRLTNQKVKYRVLNYVIIRNKLFKKTPEGVILKCLSESEAYLVVSNVHRGACGAH